MRKAFAAVAFALLIASASFAQNMVVYDADGDLYNGPDVVTGEVSDEVVISVWLVSDPAGLQLGGFGSQFCNFDGSLDIIAHEYNPQLVSWGWSVTPMTNPEPFCYLLQGVVFPPNTNYMTLPFMLGTITVHLAVDCSVDLLELDPANQGWNTPMFGTIIPDVLVGVEFIIGGTGTEESSWGAVKELFR